MSIQSPYKTIVVTLATEARTSSLVAVVTEAEGSAQPTEAMKKVTRVVFIISLVKLHNEDTFVNVLVSPGPLNYIKRYSFLF